MKWAIRIALALVLVLVLAAVLAFVFIDSIAKTGVETAATYATGVNTTLEDISLGLFTGEVELSELKMANPQGFKGEDFFSLGTGSVAVSLGTLMEEKVVLNHLILDKIYLNLEQNEDGKANYQVITDHLAKLSSSAEQQEQESSSAKKFVVEKISITNVEVDAVLIGQTVRLTIPEIQLTDVGSDTPNGVVMSQLSGVILQAILQAVVENAGDVIPGAMLGGLSTGLEGVGNITQFGVETLGNVTDQAGKALNQAGKGVEDGLKGIGDGLGGLLGGNKDEKEKP